MNRRGFFKSMLAGVATAVVAPAVILKALEAKAPVGPPLLVSIPTEWTNLLEIAGPPLGIDRSGYKALNLEGVKEQIPVIYEPRRVKSSRYHWNDDRRYSGRRA